VVNIWVQDGVEHNSWERAWASYWTEQMVFECCWGEPSEN